MQTVPRPVVYWPDLFCSDSSTCSSLQVPELKSKLLSPLLKFTPEKQPRRPGGAWLRPVSRTRVIYTRKKPDLSLTVTGLAKHRPQSVPPSLQTFPMPSSLLSRPATVIAEPVIRRQLVVSPRTNASSIRIIHVPSSLSSRAPIRLFSPSIVRNRSVRHLLVGPFM